MSSFSSSTMFGPWPLTEDTYMEKLVHAFDLFSTLVDVMDIGQPGIVGASDLAELTECLTSLMSKEMVSPSDIRSSGVLGALQEITAPKSIWPPAVRTKALLLLELWEKKFGSLLLAGDTGGQSASTSKPIKRADGMPSTPQADISKAYRVLDLPRPGSAVQLHQLVPDSIKPGAKSLVAKYATKKKVGVREEQHNGQATTPFATGSLDFPVGSWWPGPVAAARANIIAWRPIRHRRQSSKPRHKKDKREIWEAAAITADEAGGAYAILLTGSLEMAALVPSFADASHKLRFRAHPQDPQRKRPMTNLRTMAPVRILRSCKQVTSSGDKWLPPVAGVRYDGLYRISKSSLKSTDGVYSYTYELELCDEQSALKKIMDIPTRTEINEALVLKSISQRSLAPLKKEAVISHNDGNSNGTNNKDNGNDEGDDDDEEFWGITAETSTDTSTSGTSEVSEYHYSRAQAQHARQAIVGIKMSR